jgi:acetylornithine deacetylase/succinyl-diaminopimelate desuccinylase-like protein
MLRELIQIYDARKDRFIEEWKELLRFPSVSAQPEYDGACRECARWLSAQLTRIGFKAELLDSEGKPMVFGVRVGLPGAPVILYYGHYDVQPVDPLEQWVSPPFEPSLRQGRLYARGAQDNKGQVMYSLKALETLGELGKLNATVKVLLEGEEETSSRSLATNLPSWRERIAADVLMVTDTGTVTSGAPTMVMGLRGIINVSIALSGPLHDLHSGMHGGLAPNPAQGIAHLVASLHHPDGSIAVAQFYDGIAESTPRERELASQIPFSAEQYLAQTGVAPVAGEQLVDPALRVGFRPSIDINGIHSGYGGAGSKTIIPAQAIAKITARLVKGQDPARCLDALVRHLEKRVPNGLRLEITEQSIAGPGFRLDPQSALADKAKGVLDQLTDLPTAFLWEGASIPIVSALAETSGAEPLLVGFGRQEDRIHAPNESFSLEQFRLGYLYAGLMVHALGSK